MTNREFFTTVINANVSAELTDFAKEAIRKLDERNAKRTSKPSKTQLANVAIKEMIVAYITEHGALEASAIAKGISTEDTEYSTNKVSALCSQLVDSGVLTGEVRKVKSKGKRWFYAIAE